MTSEARREPACILVPLDGSSDAESSLGYAHLFSGLEGCKVELMTVREAGDKKPNRAAIEQYLQEKSVELSSGAGVQTNIEVEEGIPYLAILEEARSEDVCLVLMSTRAHSRSGRSKQDSVTNRVIRDSDCPILTIGPSCPPSPVRLNRVLLPLDGSELAEIAVPMAVGIAKMLGPLVDLVRIVEAQPSSKADHDNASSYLEAVAKALPEEVRTTCTVLYGPPTQTLEEYAETSLADLLIMSSHGGHGYMSDTLGKVTDHMIGGPVPLLVVRPGHHPRIKRLFSL